ncbi:unnamed protein product [Paramecium sonneborni]|uniref:Uncharacterized protein n=1 Tax=Paramecium sonneborni TaxID=65129 RepID=A0A8S1PZ62_9CILI|nr:unnamed protein product [Paramecium sonneborni]
MGCHIMKQNQAKNKKHFQYKLSSLHKQEGSFCALAINSKNDLLAVGSDSEIKIFNFKRGYLKQLQVISLRAYNLSLLIYCKKKPFLISAQGASSLMIWNSSLISNPKFICKMIGHSQQIISMTLDPILEDLIISGSHDNNIKFWSIYNKWFCKQTISEHTKPVLSLIMNSQGNQLISCSQDKQIFIIDRNNQTQWLIKQKILLPTYGYRLSYITDSIFIFLPNSYYDGTHLYIFKINDLIKQYQKLCQIPIQGKNQYCYYYFPLLFIQSKNILLIKNGCYVNLLQIIPSMSQNNFIYQLEQTIQFQNKYIYGTLTDDGEFLIIWDEESEQIQIRKLNIIKKHCLYSNE